MDSFGRPQFIHRPRTCGKHAGSDNECSVKVSDSAIESRLDSAAQRGSARVARRQVGRAVPIIDGFPSHVNPDPLVHGAQSGRLTGGRRLGACVFGRPFQLIDTRAQHRDDRRQFADHGREAHVGVLNSPEIGNA